MAERAAALAGKTGRAVLAYMGSVVAAAGAAGPLGPRRLGRAAAAMVEALAQTDRQRWQILAVAVVVVGVTPWMAVLVDRDIAS